MNGLDKHIENVANVIDIWLQPDNKQLQQAVERTVDEGLFSFNDVKHRILSLKASLTFGHLKKWAQMAGLLQNSLLNRQILCLHAGNLPLVGIQDLLAVLLTGGNYAGKLSRKDPYLLPTLLQKVEEQDIFQDLKWSTSLSDFGGTMDALLFAGSGASEKTVVHRLTEMNLIDKATPKLMRAANFSAAFFVGDDKETMQDLVEAVFRYGGKGCRSVAIVVAPFHLDSGKCSFTDYVEAFWLNNPLHQKAPASLEHRFALNRALNISQAWLNDFLIEETSEKPDENFVLHWVKGDFSTLREITKSFKNGLQSVYSTAEYIGRNAGEFRIEPLSEAQTPPIWWKPDQMDTIEWLQAHAGKSIK